MDIYFPQGATNVFSTCFEYTDNILLFVVCVNELRHNRSLDKVMLGDNKRE